MTYIIVDFEWNQPVDMAVNEPFFFDSEIIEIGALKLNEDFEPLDEYKAYVRPTRYRALNGKVVRLTKIRPQDLEKAKLFPTVCADFLAWCGDSFCFCTWGPDDVPVLLDNMLIHGMDVAPVVYWCDLQKIFSREIMRDDKQWSLESAVDTLGLPKERAHDALHDARNTYTICTRVDIPAFVDDYHQSYVNYDVDRLSGAKEFGSSEEMERDEALATFPCPYCGEAITLDAPVYTARNAYMRYGRCSEGDEYLGRYRITRLPDEAVSVRRSICEMTDLLWEEYQDATTDNLHPE